MANVSIKLSAFKNCDDVQLFWRTSLNGRLDSVIPGCLGFCIERKRKNKDGVFAEDQSEILRNRVGFRDGALPEEGALPEYITQPSNIWPFQTYSWTDHGANNNQTVKYRIHAMKLPEGAVLGESELEIITASAWSEEIKVTDYCGDNTSAFFNRGTVMSQYVSRVARQKG